MFNNNTFCWILIFKTHRNAKKQISFFKRDISKKFYINAELSDGMCNEIYIPRSNK